MPQRSSLKYDLDTLEQALKIIASIVTKYGDKYLPIFERVLNEVEILRNQHSLKMLAIQLANNDD